MMCDYEKMPFETWEHIMVHDASSPSVLNLHLHEFRIWAQIMTLNNLRLLFMGLFVRTNDDVKLNTHNNLFCF